MKSEPFLLASSMTAVMAQRVLRKICDDCKESYVPDPAVIADIKEVLGGFFKENGMVLYRGKGCEKCGKTGYFGRVGIFEVISVSDKIAKLIMERADAAEIERQAVVEGMMLMKQDGYMKALEGMTTLEEVIRVAQI